MTTTSLPQDSSSIIADVEAYISELPEKRRRKRTHAEIYEPDQTPEIENYVADSELEPDSEALAEFRRLLRQLRQARSDVVAEVITAKIYKLLDLPLDGGR